MAQYALEALLVPLDGDSASGPNLEYDLDFQALERAAAPKSERAIGDSVIAAEEPDWEDVANRATTLFTRTRDLRVAMHLATAWLRMDGLAGWAAGLQLIHGLLENFWSSVHPQLDADDDNDPTFRVNSVAPLGNILGTLRYFRITPFVQSQRLGRFTLRDLRLANGSLKPTAPVGGQPAPQLPTMVMIEGCCKDCPEQQLIDNTAAIGLAMEHAKGIDETFTAQLGISGPDLKNLLADVFEVKKFLDAQLKKRLPAETGPAAKDSDDDDDSDEAPSASVAGVSAAGGRISSPKDVISRIDELCEYYARFEPSSPVPLLLRRAQRLVGRDFIDLLKDLAPSGIPQLQVISGVSAASGAGASPAASSSAFVDDDD